MATVAKNTRSTLTTISVSSAGPFNLGFRLFDTDAILVYVNGVKVTNWTLSATFANGFTDAATITFTTAVTAPADIIFDSALVPWRSEDLISGDKNLVSRLNVELSRIESTLAELRRDADRAVKGFATIEPVLSVNANSIAAAGTNATAAAASAAAAAASAAAAAAAQNTILKPKGQWLTGTNYGVGDTTYQLGSQYECIVPHTSGTFATDLAAAKWRIFVLQGAAGAGTGDVLAANNGSEYVANSNVFRNTLGLPVSPILKRTALDILTTNYNQNGEFSNIGTGCTNMPAGGADGDHLFAKVFDANNLVLVWFRANGTISVNKRNAGTWTGWIEQATQAFVAAAIATSQQILHAQDRKAVGTVGGTFTAGSYLTRILNGYQTNTISGASLASNQITLPTGTYEVDAMCPACAVNRHKAVFYNVTDAAIQLPGTSEYSWASGFTQTNSLVRGRFTIAAQKVFEIRHRCETTQASTGFGVNSSMTYDELYTDVRISKIS